MDFEGILPCNVDDFWDRDEKELYNEAKELLTEIEPTYYVIVAPDGRIEHITTSDMFIKKVNGHITLADKTDAEGIYADWIYYDDWMTYNDDIVYNLGYKVIEISAEAFDKLFDLLFGVMDFVPDENLAQVG